MHPLMIYGLQAISNYSFEIDADAVDPPTGWDTTGSTNGINEVDDAEYHYVGDGIPSLKALKQNVDNATGGNEAIARQRFALSNLPTFFQREGRVELVAAAMMKAANQVGLENAQVRIRQYNGGTSVPGSGTERTSPAQRSFDIAGPETEWLLRCHAATIYSDTEWIDISLEYVLGTYGAAADVWWDQAFLGALLDFPKGFRTLSFSPSFGFDVNAGAGVVEVVKYAPAESSVSLSVKNIFEDPLTNDNFHLRVMDFKRWLQSDQVGTLALWGDRTLFTNDRRHFQEMYVDAKLSFAYPAGIARKNLEFKLVAPNEV